MARDFAAVTAALIVVILLAGDGLAQCKNGRCGNVTAPPAVVQLSHGGQVLAWADGWHESTRWPGWHFWMQQNVCRAWFHPATNAFCTYDQKTDRCGPIELPPWAPERQPVKFNFGMDRPTQPPQPPRYTISDGQTTRPATRDEAMDAVAGGEVTDDSTKPRLTIVAPDQELRRRVQQDLDGPLADLRAKACVQLYGDPRHHHLESFKLDRDSRFQASHFAAYWQPPGDPRGTAPILRGVYGYGGPEALRRTDPAYDPDKHVPDGKPRVPGLGELKAYLPYLLGGAAAVCVALALRSRREPGEEEQAPAPRRGRAVRAPPASMPAPAPVTTEELLDRLSAALALEEADRVAAEKAKAKAAKLAAVKEQFREVLAPRIKE